MGHSFLKGIDVSKAPTPQATAWWRSRKFGQAVTLTRNRSTTLGALGGRPAAYDADAPRWVTRIRSRALQKSRDPRPTILA